MTLTKIDTYGVLYSSNTFAPEIWLKAGGNYIGSLNFMPNGSTLPDDSMAQNSLGQNVAMLYYHLDDFQNVIDLLRNDAPVSLLYNGSGGGFQNGIQTADETVG